ncbi:MAG TPA: flavin prenyltransferase UbiX [Gemmatales bacterium]|nr:flavin prenyltransferase UbiX [Gemmatales bacterium]
MGITGASGAPYAKRLLEVLVRSGRTIHVTMSPAAVQVFQAELEHKIDLRNTSLAELLPVELQEIAHKQLHYHHFMNFSAGIASGSFRTGGMVVCPCSMGTIAAIAHGTSQNLIHRAADVHLKERRKLILVPRETPLGLVQLRNLAICAEAGAVVLPAMPAYYTQPKTIQDMVDFVVARIADQLDIEHQLGKRWGTDSKYSG